MAADRNEESGGAPKNIKGSNPAPKPAPKAIPARQANQAKAKTGKIKLPRSAAVTITSAGGNYEEIFKEARNKIKLADLGITTDLKPKRAQTGGLIIEIPGAGNSDKADILAERLIGVFADRPDIKIARPTKTAEIRVMDLDDSVSAEK
ncbi:uncharacterized protein LOC112459339 [Temnothorax curvispinosus]|uniref:Uncharacterized protein LOC112459339 n=1 Tax=Temnothorax curvispinosus TaxID=300111 RepID=A0A6J1QA71_9HYME|nr:uncharacterized protein LOC112459339 [Temnothorax curvispinosus]